MTTVRRFELPDRLVVAVDGQMPPAADDGPDRSAARVVLSMPDYVADNLAHLLAQLSRAAGLFGGLEDNGIPLTALAAAVYSAAVSGDYRCPRGALELERVTVDPEVMSGLPCIRGTRIPVLTMRSMYQAGAPAEALLCNHPFLTEADVQAALDWPVALEADPS